MGYPETPARLAALAMVALMVLCIPAGPVDIASAEVITKFTNDATEWTLNFEDQGTLNDASFRVPVDGKVLSATFDITGLDYGGSNPSTVRAFVGSIDDRVYEWKGDTFGAMGYQTLLASGATEGTMEFKDAGSNSSLALRLPDGAKVSSGALSLTGMLYDGGWASAQKLTHKVDNNIVDLSVSYYSSPQLIDMDGDGDLDVLSRCYMTTGGTRVRWIVYIENTGSATSMSWEIDNQAFPMGMGWSLYFPKPLLVDLDEDGALDLTMSNYNYQSGGGQILVYWNTGTNANPTWSAANSSIFSGIGGNKYLITQDFADLDGDGDVDLGFGSYDQGGTSTVGLDYYRNDYANGEWSWVSGNLLGGITTDSFSSPDMYDFDGDGDYDLFVGLYDGTFGFYENTGTTSSPTWTQRSSVQGNIDVGMMASPTVGDLNGDGYDDLLIGAYDGLFYYYQNMRRVPLYPKLDVGADGDFEWTYTEHSGKFETTAVAAGLAAEIEANNKGDVSKQDNWGNKFHDIPLKVVASSSGLVKVSGVKVRYDYTAKSKDFAEALNDWIYQNREKADANGMLKVPIIIESGSKGGVRLSGLRLEIDRAPVWSEIPSTYFIDEDTKNMQLIDLWSFVTDDYDTDDRLAFEVIDNSAKGVIDVSIQEGRYLGIDAATGDANDNWNGWVTIALRVTDRSGLVGKSNHFKVEVRPVNDPPTISGSPPASVLEDTALDYTFTGQDVDDERLEWAIKGPAGMTINRRGTVSWTPGNSDVGFHDIVVTVTDSGGLTASLPWRLEVVNVNDAPVLSLPGEVIATEGKPYYLDLKGSVSDIDNPLSDIKMDVSAKSPFATFDPTTWVVTLNYPKESGWTEDALIVMVKDLEASVTGTIRVGIVQVKKLAVMGLPDQAAVEEDTWTLDIKPYMYNVEDWNTLVITASSTHVTVTGTRLTFYYARGSLPALEETVVVTARQKDETATDDLVVRLQKLGHDLTLLIVPDQYVVEGETSTLDITPYIKNYASLDLIRVGVSGTSHVTVDGRTLAFLYPIYFTRTNPPTQTITITIRQEEFSSSRDVVVHIANGESDFYIAEIPDVDVTETIAETFNVKQYIMNAVSFDYIEVSTNSLYAVVNRFDVQLTYPEDFTGTAETVDDLVTVIASDGLHKFERSVTVHVHMLGKLLQLSGIGDRTVFEDTSLVVDIEPYLYNVDDLAKVGLEIDSAYGTVAGLVATFRFPASAGVRKETVTFTATEGTDVARETIIIYVEPIPVDEFVFGQISSIAAVEDEPFVLDLRPFLKNMAPSATYTAGVRSAHATAKGLVVTLLYPDGPMEETLYINVTGTNGDFAWQDVFVTVKSSNDRPRLLKDMPFQLNIKQGEAPTVINLTGFFSDEDTARLEFTASDNAKLVVHIDNVNGSATIAYRTGETRPDDVEGAVIFAYDPADPTSRTGTNAFNITFYKANEKPPDTPTGLSYLVGGGWGGAAVMTLVLVAFGGAAWVLWRRRNRITRYGPEPPQSAFK